MAEWEVRLEPLNQSPCAVVLGLVFVRAMEEHGADSLMKKADLLRKRMIEEGEEEVVAEL